MLRFSRTGLGVASVAAIVLVSGFANAQVTPGSSGSSSTTTSTTPSSTAVCSLSVTTPTVTAPSSQLVPERFVNGADLGTSTRPFGEVQTGISYADCLADMVLQFRTIACGFTGGINLEAWASTQSDCTAKTDRGLGGVGAICWPVGASVADLIQGDGPENFSIRVRDIVGPQNQSPSPITYTRRGLEACSAQQSSLAVPININFVPVDSVGNYAGSGALQFHLGTDMVGPPAPTGVRIADGDTLFVVSWTPNVDTDTAAYDIVIDPPPGQAVASGAVTTVEDCPDVGAPSAPSSGAGDQDSSSDAETGADADSAAADATTDGSGTVADASCHSRNVAVGSGSCAVCSDPLLMGGTMVGTGTTAPTTTTTVDEAGNDIDSSVVGPTNGGVWTPPAGHVLSPNSTTGSTITGQTNSTYTIKGLTNGTCYTVALAAVDNYGNVGPPSNQACDFPAPVTDFWKIYRGDGGQAGGYCALEAVGSPAGSTVAFAGAGSLVVATLRRRRKRRR